MEKGEKTIGRKYRIQFCVILCKTHAMSRVIIQKKN